MDNTCRHIFPPVLTGTRLWHFLKCWFLRDNPPTSSQDMFTHLFLFTLLSAHHESLSHFQPKLIVNNVFWSSWVTRILRGKISLKFWTEIKQTRTTWQIDKWVHFNTLSPSHLVYFTPPHLIHLTTPPLSLLLPSRCHLVFLRDKQ